MLDQLVNTQKENNKRLAAIERSVNNLVKVNTATAKREKEAANKAARMGRREKALAGGSERSQHVREMLKQKKQTKSFMENIMGFLKNPIMLLAVGGLLVAGVMKALENPKVKAAIAKLFDIIKVKLKQAWDFVLPKIKEGMKFLKPYFEEAAAAAGNVLKDMIKNAFKEALNFARNFIPDWLMGNDRNRGAERAAQAGGAEAERIKKVNKLIEEKLRLEKEMYRRERAAQQFRESGRSQKDIDKELEAVEIKRAKIAALLEEIKLEEQLYKDKNIYREQDFRMRREDEIQRGVLNPRDWTTGDVAQKLQEAFNALKGALGFQRGGPLTVPGSGSGDKMFTFLQPGSFVMNRNASKVGGYQMGGVPVMLEPGEHVYGPGQWDAGHMLLNSLVPRFQEGGNVDVKKSDGTYATGPGWQPDSLKDAKGRPIIVSKDAAIAIMKMYKAGKFKGSDVNSAQRSPGHNAAVGGVPNSKHLSGNALDVQTGSSTWHALKNAGPQYGWKWNDYMGPQGWHFDFVGGGGSPKEGNEGKIAGDIAKDPNLVPDLTTTGELLGKGAEEIVNAAGNMGGRIAKPFLDGIRNMGLPGLADALSIFGSGMKAIFGPAVNFIASGIGNFASGFVGSIFGMQPANASGPTPNTGGTSPHSILADSLGIKPQGGKGPVPQGAPAVNAMATGGDKIDKQILDMIASVEAAKSDPYGGFNTSRGRTSGRAVDKTIGWLAQNAQGAIGRYQHMPQFLADRAIAAGIPLDTKFTPEVQDRLTLHFLKGEGGGMYEKWKAGKVGHSEMGNELSRIWRGLPHSTGGTYPDQYAGGNAAHMSRKHMMAEMKRIRGYAMGGPVSNTGSIVNMGRASQPMLKRLSDNMGKVQAMRAQGSQPIIIPVPMGGGGGGGTVRSGSGGTPEAPGLPDGPQVVALLELQNRLALGAMM